MRYCVLYPQAENVHLIKDVGMIAYKIHKLFGYDSYVVCYDNDDYKYLQNEVKGLKIDFLNKRLGNDIIDGCFYLAANSSKIDILQLFHVTLRSVIFALCYKMFNRKGKIFLKLDCTNKLIDEIKRLSGLKKSLFNLFFNKTDVIGVEQHSLYNELKVVLPKYTEKIIYIPNGIDFESSNIYNETSFESKENIILNVGRLGSEEKNTKLLVDAFEAIHNIESKEWTLELIGPLDDKFKVYLEELFENNPKLKEKIILKGPIYDRNELYREYSRAKVFCLSSNFESFGIALLEAASLGDVIVSTDVGIAKEIVSNNNGEIVEIGNKEDLIRALKSVMENRELDEISKNTQKLCREKYDWNTIVQRLNEKLME